MWSEKTNASEPLMMGRNVLEDVETGQDDWPGREPRGCVHFCLGGVRPEGGVSSDLAAVRNVGTSRADAKGEVQVGGPREDQRTDAAARGGVARSSGEAGESGWSEGATSSSYTSGSTSDGRSPWV